MRSHGQIDEKVETGEESEAAQKIGSQVASGKKDREAIDAGAAICQTRSTAVEETEDRWATGEGASQTRGASAVRFRGDGLVRTSGILGPTDSP